jgi:fucose 4-O-acetylase-like acetyltransferase
MIDNISSQKIKVISLSCMLFVIYLHSYNLNDITSFTKDNISFSFSILHFNVYFQNLFSQGVTQLAVPIFFLISGFFLFTKKNSYINLIKKKFYTLVVPYFFWALLYVLIILVLQSIPKIQDYFNSALVNELTTMELIYHTWIQPKNYPLWFLRDLIFLVSISPIIKYFIEKNALVYFLILVPCWFVDLDAGPRFYHFILGPLIFFSLGIYLSFNQNIFLKYKIKKPLYITIFITYMILLLIKTFFFSFFLEYSILVNILHKISILIGVPTLWFTFDYFFLNSNLLLNLSKYTFILYVFHEPWLTMLKRGLFLILGKNENFSFIIYLISPILIIITLTYIGKSMKYFLPNFTHLVTGKRM